ncbi:MAG TPA: hypothetical protein DCO75_10695 [Fibrobacteres bacterium]|jgi:iron complex transport system substrate-binding protein|nr:hypothetical protein [Fibrobacterota bacterium]
MAKMSPIKGACLTIIYKFLCIVLLILSACSHSTFKENSNIPMRIVSLAPGITETLFALGLGSRIIGVTRYCTYPLQTKGIEKIGGYSDANIEKIVSMHPDLVILSREHEKQQSSLNRFGVSTLMIDNSSCAAICSSFAVIGRRCGVFHATDSLILEFNDKLTKPARQAYISKILFCVGRDNPGSGRIKSVYIAGRSSYYNDLIEAAGGKNVFTDSVPAYPQLSTEGILSLAPDVIIDVAPSMENCNCNTLVADWNSMDRIPAVKNKRIYCIANDYATVPGPRILLLLDDLKRIVADTEVVAKDNR